MVINIVSCRCGLPLYIIRHLILFVGYIGKNPLDQWHQKGILPSHSFACHVHNFLYYRKQNWDQSIPHEEIDRDRAFANDRFIRRFRILSPYSSFYLHSNDQQLRNRVCPSMYQ